MRITEDTTDLFWGADGDLRLEGSDLKQATGSDQRVLHQQILSRLSSSRYDWELHPDFGASLGDFRGSRNTEEVARLIGARIVQSLLDIVAAKDITIRVLPIAESQVFVQLVVNSRRAQSVFLNLTYDLRDDQLIPRNI